VVEKLGGVVVGVALAVDLPDLGGRRRLEKQGHSVVALCEFEGE
jgi:adenine phosphoribosyltransferase